MVYDAETIQQAMARAGRLAQLDFADTLAAFDKLGLTPEERLAAIAGAIAACRAKRHAADGPDFIAGLRELTRPALGWLGDGAGGELFLTRVVEGVRLLAGGLDRIVAQLAENAISGNGARLIETAMLARLLAAHRPHQIARAIGAAEHAASRPDYTPGDVVPLPPAPPAGGRPRRLTGAV